MRTIGCHAASISRLAFAAALFAAAGCREAAAPAPLRIVHESDPISLDPVAVAEAATHSILSNIYDGLVGFDRDMRLVPALATSWSTVDEWTWLLQLRPGVRFHDGTTFTAYDAKFSLDRAKQDPSSGIKGHLSNLKDVRVEGPLTLRLRTLEPDPLLLNELAYVMIVPASRSRDYAARPVGTGPYRFVRWLKGHALEVEAFGNHWGGRPAIERVEFVPGGEAARTASAFTRGDVHVWRFVPETMVAQLRSAPGVRIARHSGLITIYLWFNCMPRGGDGRNPFSDSRVRRAVSLAIDRGEIVRRLDGNGLAASQLVPQGVFGFVSALPQLPFAPDESIRLLTDAGYPDGFDAALASSKTYTLVAELLKTMLGRVHVRLALEAPDWSQISKGWKAGSLPAFVAGWRCENGDAASFLKDCLFTRDPKRATGAYNPGFSDPTLDRLIDENQRVLGDVKRLHQYGQLMRCAMETMPVVPLYHRFDLYGISNRVRWEPRLDGKLLAAEMSWISP